MTDPDATPIVVAESAAGAQTGSALAAVLMLLGALPTLVAIFGRRDVVEIASYLASNEFAQLLGVLVTLGTIGWRQYRIRMSHRDKVTIAQAAPDAVAVVR